MGQSSKTTDSKWLCNNCPRRLSEEIPLRIAFDFECVCEIAFEVEGHVISGRIFPKRQTSGTMDFTACPREIRFRKIAPKLATAQVA